MSNNVCPHGVVAGGHPCPYCWPHAVLNPHPMPVPSLTIRQQAVLMAMQGLLSAGPVNGGSAEMLAEAACLAADAVLKAERGSRKPNP